MNSQIRPILFKTCLCGAFLFASVGSLLSQPAKLWEAFNDHRPAAGVTSPNATGYEMIPSANSGLLKNIETGEDLPAGFYVTVESDNNAKPDDFGTNSEVDPGSPAALLFNGKVDIGNNGLPGVRASAHMKLVLNFYGLDPARRYNFRGTVARGGGYDNRWTLFGIGGSEVYVAAHVDGSKNKNIFTLATFPKSAISTNQVALNTGDNKAGSLVGWDNIEPVAVLAQDGSDSFGFQIAAEQYLGLAPFGSPAAASTQYAYTLDVLYLAEVEATGNLRVTQNPDNIRAAAGKRATFAAAATSTLPVRYQWQKSSGGAPFADIQGATSGEYTTPILTLADEGTTFRCAITSGADHTVTGEAILSVDGVVPTLSSASASIHFNSIYVTFSEAMKLEQLATPEHYSIDGGITVVSAAALDPQTVRLVTSDYAAGKTFIVTVKDVEDLAGNAVPSKSSAAFRSFSLTPGLVGLELWKGIAGSTPNDLLGNARYPLDYDVDYSINGFDSTLALPNGPLNTYGGRMRAWLTPEVDGEYEFFLDADDQGEIRISLEDESFDTIDAAETLPIATDTTSADGFKESGLPSTSAPIALAAGHKYPIQVIWKESNGGDFARIAWRAVGDATPASELPALAGPVLSYYGLTSSIRISGRPDGKVLLEWDGPVLESSDDLVQWTQETGLTSPSVVVVQGRKFYRSR